MKKTSSFILSLALFGLVGCSGFTPEKPAVPLTGGEWRLEDESLHLSAATPGPDQPITLRFSGDSKVYGCSGVNRYFGGAKWDEASGKLKFGALGVTRMAGPGMAFENAYLGMLDQVVSYRIEGRKLRLFNAEGKEIGVFEFQKELI